MKLINPDNCSVCIIGLGYVGLPLINSIAKSNKKRKIIGFDKSISRINDLKKGGNKIYF